MLLKIDFLLQLVILKSCIELFERQKERKGETDLISSVNSQILAMAPTGPHLSQEAGTQSGSLT